MSKSGRPVVISAASGTGKSTIIREVLKLRPEMAFCVSVTTRTIREGEIDGINYHFISEPEFKAGIEEGRFIEWEIVHGNYYGTERQPLEELLESGKNVILDIDVKGGKNMKKAYPQTLMIFIYPPSFDELTRRLEQRSTETKASIVERLARYSMEMLEGSNYSFRVMNNTVELSVERVLQIIESNGNQ